MEIRFNVRTAAKRRADFGEDKKIWRTLIAEANSPLKKKYFLDGWKLKEKVKEG